MSMTDLAEQKRLKFQTRTIKLIGEPQRDASVAVIRNVPVGAGLEVVVREEVRARGLDQNGLYWLRLGEISEQGWLDGKRYSKEAWHHYAGQNLMPEIVTPNDGAQRSKWIEVPKGEPVVISTALLERKFFSQYITIVEAFGAADLGVLFSANPRDAQ